MDSVTRSAFIDRTIGENTTLVFTYKQDIEVTISTVQDYTAIITKDTKLKIVTVVIPGLMVGVFQVSTVHA